MTRDSRSLVGDWADPDKEPELASAEAPKALGLPPPLVPVSVPGEMVLGAMRETVGGLAPAAPSVETLEPL